MRRSQRLGAELMFPNGNRGVENERVMESRMAHLAEEKMTIEKKVVASCIVIQKYIRMKLCRDRYLRYKAN